MTPPPDGPVKVLVKEKIADSGVDLLRENFEVDLGLEMSDEELGDAIGSYDAILIRSATQITADTTVVTATFNSMRGFAGAPAAWPGSPGSAGVTQRGSTVKSVIHQTNT